MIGWRFGYAGIPGECYFHYKLIFVIVCNHLKLNPIFRYLFFLFPVCEELISINYDSIIFYPRYQCKIVN